MGKKYKVSFEVEDTFGEDTDIQSIDDVKNSLTEAVDETEGFEVIGEMKVEEI